MKTVIIADVHHDIRWVKSILEHEHPDHTIFTGDFFDTRDINLVDAFNEVVAFLKKVHADDRYTIITGNHDAQYVQNILSSGCATSLSCGVDNDVLGAVRQIHPITLKQIFCRASKLITLENGNHVLFTHAGVSDIIVEAATPEELHQLIESKWTDAWQNTFFDLHKIIGNIGKCRGGFDPVGGILWRDNNKEQIGVVNPSVIKMHQIFGHTTIREPKKCGYKVNNFMQICLDGAQTIYGVLEKNVLTVKTTTKNIQEYEL